PEPVRKRDHMRLPIYHDDDAVQLGPGDVLLENRLPSARMRERLRQPVSELLHAFDDEDTALTSGVGRLEHCRRADGSEGVSGIAAARNWRVPRLLDAARLELLTHHVLIRHRARSG